MDADGCKLVRHMMPTLTLTRILSTHYGLVINSIELFKTVRIRRSVALKADTFTTAVSRSSDLAAANLQFLRLRNRAKITDGLTTAL